MPGDLAFPPNERDLRLHIGEEARELLASAVRRDPIAFFTLTNEVIAETYQGLEIANEADWVPGPSYLQSFLVYAMRVAAAVVREALEDDEQAIEDLITRVCTSIEVGDLTI